MALTMEWRRRIDGWMNTLTARLYRPCAKLDLEGFASRKSLTMKQARRGRFRPMPEGTAWGAKWEYGWFRCRIKTTREMAGKRLMACLHTGGESVAYVNGAMAGGIDRHHFYTPLSRQAVAGRVFEILVESYAGHGARLHSVGPVPEGTVLLPEPPVRQCTIGACTVGVWDENAYQLSMDVRTLLLLRDSMPVDSLRVAEIDAGLRDFTLLCDLEAPSGERDSGITAARRRLRPLLACQNGDTAPLMYCVGHSHLDVAWLWPLAETQRKISRTWSSQLALLDEYPEYLFLQSQPHLYWMCKHHYPALYRQIRRKVRQGRIIPEGGMWVEADTNISGGESLIRQFLHGKRFFQKEFGLDNRLLWLPDVFGYSGALPQIMKGCGIDYFSTSKIFWNYNGGDPFPYNSFQWEGIDGTRVLAHLYKDYNSLTDPRALIEHWDHRVQKDGIRTRLVPFGYGDGGGGAVRDHLEHLRREVDLEGMPRTVISHPLDFFTDLEKSRPPLPTYVGELYYQCHRGTYTSQARTKKGNRRCEFALREAEMWGAAAAWMTKNYRYPRRAMGEAWRQILLNQFHDIIPGSSIARVYEEAEAGYSRVLKEACKTADQASRKLVKASRHAVTVFNSLSWPRTVLTPLPKTFRGATDESGKSLATQKIGGTLFAEVPAVPSCGWTTVVAAPAGSAKSTLRVSVDELENEYLRIRLDTQGRMLSVWDKEAGRELAAGPCNDFRMYKDVPSRFDAWDIDSTYAAAPVALNSPAQRRICERGPLTVGIEIRRRLNRSELVQVIRLRRGSHRMDFSTTIDWHEKHKLLKVNFPVDIHTHEAIHEIQFGHLARPTHQSRPFDADRFEVSAHKWTALTEQNRGCAILNDCKYGVNAEHGSINLTLLKSPLAPDEHADLGRQEFTYSFFAWNGSFAESDLIAEAYDLNAPAWVTPGHGGRCSLFTLDHPNIVIETVKPAEDGSGDMIVRLYESRHMSTRCVLTTTLPGITRVLETTMLEQPLKSAGPSRSRWSLSFRPFEIKTLRLSCG